MAKPIVSAFADEYKTDIDGQIKGLSEFGIGKLELRFVDSVNIVDCPLSVVEAVKEKLGKNNITLSAIGSPIGKINTGGDIEAEILRAERAFQYANLLGAKNIRIFSFYLDDKKTKEENKSIVFNTLERLVKLASKYGVTLCHENEAKIYGESPMACREILDYFGGEMKCVFDMGNFVLDSYSPYPDAYELLRDHIEYFHIKDSLSAGAVVPPGCGEAKIKEIIAAHNKYSKSDYIITLEPHLQTFSGLNALVGKSFDNPYKYETPELAFADAVNRLMKII